MGWDVVEASQRLVATRCCCPGIAIGGARGDPAMNSALGPRTRDEYKMCALKPFKIDELHQLATAT
jgi:hypothetical protein